jgi:hypothetical protein
MRFHFRRTHRLGPIRVTLTERGLRWGVRVGRYGYDPRTGKHSFNTPGLGYVRTSGRNRAKGTPVKRRSPAWGVLGFVVILVLATFAFGPSLWAWS